MAVSLAVQVDERNIKFAIYYGELSDTDSAATDAAFDRKILITVFLAISALLLINIFSVTDHWTREKKGEIRARIISGGSPADICGGLLLNYTIIVLTAVVIGTALAGGFLTLDLLVVKQRHFIKGFWTACSLSLLFSAVGIVIGAASVRKTQNKLIGGTR